MNQQGGSPQIGIYTKKQIDYVNSVPDSELRSHLLHQVRLRDNMEADRDSFQKLNNDLVKKIKDIRFGVSK